MADTVGSTQHVLPDTSVLIVTPASFLAGINIYWLQERSEAGITRRVMSLAMFAAVAIDPMSYLLAGAFVELNPTAVFLADRILLVLTALLGATSRTMRTAD